MKKILTSNIVENVRRQPFNKASLEHIQEAFQEVFADLLKGLTDNAAGVVVLHGCVDSDPDANDYDISAGAVLYNGEVFQVDAFVGSDATDVPVLSLVETYRAGDPVKFSDNNDYNVHVIRKLQWSMATAGSGIVDFDQLVRFKDTLKPNSVNAGKTVRFKAIDIGPWNINAGSEKVIAFSEYEVPHEKICGTIVHLRSDNAIELNSNRFETSNYDFSGANVVRHYYEYVGGNYQLLLNSSQSGTGWDNAVDNRGKVIIFYEE